MLGGFVSRHQMGRGAVAVKIRCHLGTYLCNDWHFVLIKSMISARLGILGNMYTGTLVYKVRTPHVLY